MGIPSNWPPAYKRAMLLTASFIVLIGYLSTCLALIRLATLLIH
jgi:hypothetical protein